MPAAASDIGCERELNEDRYGLIECPLGTAYIVCDGMGGETGGDLAAQLAIDAIRRVLENAQEGDPLFVLESSINEANRVIALRRQNQTFSSMGTTIAVAFKSGNSWSFGSAGDSRAYLLSGGSTTQITEDHTFVQELVNSGEITLSEALNHPQAHVLTRCLGAQPTLLLDKFSLWEWESEEKDVVLLCTDGLYSLVSDQEIRQTVMSCEPQEACVELVELAKARGGYDNITLAIIPVQGKLTREENRATIGAELKSKTRFADNPDEIRPLLMNSLAVLVSATAGLCIGSALLLLMLSQA